MYNNKILSSQESTTILNAYTKKSVNLLKAPGISSFVVESNRIKGLNERGGRSKSQEEFRGGGNGW